MDSRCFLGVSSEKWNDWRWQYNNRIVDVKTLSKFIDISEKKMAELGMI